MAGRGALVTEARWMVVPRARLFTRSEPIVEVLWIRILIQSDPAILVLIQGYLSTLLDGVELCASRPVNKFGNNVGKYSYIFPDFLKLFWTILIEIRSGETTIVRIRQCHKTL